MLEIKFRGRGGQGAVIASEILGKCFFLEGKWPQAFSLFGSERRGAPVFGFLRVDEAPIFLKCQIEHPDHVVIFDLGLADEKEVFAELKPGGVVLLNTGFGIERFDHWRSYTLGLINASAVARSAGLGDTFNMAILGAYVRMTGLVKIESLLSVVRTAVPAKIEANVEAARRAYEDVRIYRPGEF
jgi:2-oxoacid:acceptor oxidoreductase gamma subunit (pyruvate/2-ketoisovalerate family)